MKSKAFRMTLLGSALSAAVAFAPAAAADGPDRGPRPGSWTGLYIGIHAGAGQADIDWANVSLTGEPASFDTTGFIGGGQIGYNAQIGRWVFGIEAAISGASLTDTVDSVVGGGITFTSGVDWIGAVTGRLGYAGDTWLVYGKGGWAIAGLDLRGNNPGLPDAFSLSETATGWTAGAGIEWKLARNLSLAVEYNFIDLGSHDVSGVTAIGIPFTLSGVDTQIQSITARLNVKLGQ
jgi:outer membrane immunogenic protein